MAVDVWQYSTDCASKGKKSMLMVDSHEACLIGLSRCCQTGLLLWRRHILSALCSFPHNKQSGDLSRVCGPPQGIIHGRARSCDRGRPDSRYYQIHSKTQLIFTPGIPTISELYTHCYPAASFCQLPYALRCGYFRASPIYYIVHVTLPTTVAPRMPRPVSFRFHSRSCLSQSHKSHDNLDNTCHLHVLPYK